MINNRTFLAVAFAATLLLSGCRGKHTPEEVKNEEPPAAAQLLSHLRMEDASIGSQLLQGFYPPETGAAWRWTAGKFAVVLKSPLGAAEKGATLTLKFAFPEPVFKATGPVTLAAVSGATKLGTQTLSAPGPYTFTAAVAPDLLGKESVTIDFVLDKSLPPGQADKRELGIIATLIALESR